MSPTATLGLDSIREKLPQGLMTRVEQVLNSRWFPWVVNLGVLVLLLAAAAFGAWRIWMLWFAARSPEAVLPTEAVGGKYNVQQLIATNLFGVALTPGTQRVLPLEAIPLTSLNIVISGILLRGGGSFAIATVNGQPEEPYTLGAEIAPGATVQAIYPDRILISRGGVTEAAIIKDGVPAASGAPAVLPTAPVAPPTMPAITAPGLQRLSNNTFAVQREQVTKQVSNPDVLKQALIVPNPGGGFQVRDIQPGSVYEQLGLRQGDVIRTVNGQQINRVEDVMKLYQQYKTSGTASITLDISRAGRPQQLTYNMQ
jgi:general secretion pathway protein C